ncbi:MAG: hypothetical protein KDE35_17640 [Geminicoccaceae bacterium]|nr:hypothetical protein [Geminicoccaceae bacterium]
MPTTSTDTAASPHTRLAGLLDRLRDLESGRDMQVTGMDRPLRDDLPEPALAVIERARAAATSFRPHRLESEIEKTRDLIAATTTEAQAAREAEDRRRAEDQDARIGALAPEHRRLVAVTAHHLDELGACLAEEQRLRSAAGLGRISDNPRMPAFGLPELGRAADPNSRISQWFRRARALGYLEG